MTEQLETANIQERDSYLTGEKDLLGEYLDEIAKTPLLRAEEEVELAQAIELGTFAQHLLDSTDQIGFTDDELTELDPGQEELEWIAAEGLRAQEKFYLANRRLVVNVAARYSRRATASHTLLDMIQDGNIGLRRAIRDFDYAQGNKFSTFAVWCIRYEVGEGVRGKSRAMPMPKQDDRKVNQVYRSEQILSQTLQHDPTIMDVANDLGRSYQEVAHLKALGTDEISLNTEISREGGTARELSEVVAAPDHGINAARAQKIRDGISQAILATLSQRDAEIIVLNQGMYGREWSYAELAERYNLTPEGVKTCVRRAFMKIRNKNPELLDLVN